MVKMVLVRMMDNNFATFIHISPFFFSPCVHHNPGIHVGPERRRNGIMGGIIFVFFRGVGGEIVKVSWGVGREIFIKKGFQVVKRRGG